MSNFRSTEVITTIEENGEEVTTKTEKSTSITRNDEPDYIKVYTNMWAEFNGVPAAYRDLFLQLAIRMTYCNADDLGNAQIVAVGGPVGEGIRKTLNIKERAYKYGLQALVKAGAIKSIRRGWYQINPTYAGKGEWKYNPKLQRGGVEQLVATFKITKDGTKTVDTAIIWADNGEQTEFNHMYRQGMGVQASDETVLTHTVTTPTETQNHLERQNKDYEYRSQFDRFKKREGIKN